MLEENKVIDIDKKRKSQFSIFDSIAEEKKWIERVKGECLKICIEKEEK